MDSDSDIEIVPNSVDDGFDNCSLGSASSSSSTSLPSLPKKRVQRSISSRPVTLSISSTSSSRKCTSSSKLPDTSSSDIEFMAGPSVANAALTRVRGAGTDLTNRIRATHSRPSSSSRSTGIGGFKSAAAILKEDAKKEKAAAKRRSSSASSSDTAAAPPLVKTASRDSGPYLSTGSDAKGKGTDNSLPPLLSPVNSVTEEQDRQLEDEDDDFVELPPPLRTTFTKSKTPIKASSLIDEEEEVDLESPGAAFRSTLNKFKAPSIASSSTSTRSRGSLFSGSTMANKRISSSITALSDSSFVSTSTSIGSMSTKRAPSIFDYSSASSTTQLQLPTPFVMIITKCPTCNDAWTIFKDPKTKLNHIRKCALQKSYSNAEVNKLVEDQVRELYHKAEEKNRIHHDNRTLLEGVISRKGKEVQVVGVEKKKKPQGKQNELISNAYSRDNSEAPHMDEEEKEVTREVVLSTQGGSTYSQATSTQVYKELTKRIKTNQRIERGDFLNVATSARSAIVEAGTRSASDSVASDDASAKPSVLAEAAAKARRKKGTADANGVGSKNWLKAAQLLKAKEKDAMEVEDLEASSLLSTAHIGASIASTLASNTSSSFGTAAKGKQQASSANTSKTRLEPYSDSRFRLAEKVKDIAALRTRKTDSSAESDIESVNAATRQDTGSNDEYSGMERPYRNPSDLSLSLLDKAIQRGSEKRKQGYDAWALAGTAEDTVRDRYVSQSSPPSSPPNDYARISPSDPFFSDYDDDLHYSEHPTAPSTQFDHQSHPIASDTGNHLTATPPSSPPIAKLSLSSRTPSPVRQSPTTSPTSHNSHTPYFVGSNLPSEPVSLNIASVVGGSSSSAVGPTTTIPDDSSSGLFKSSAALQALTQKLKATSSSSTNPFSARRAARMAAGPVSVLSLPSQAGSINSQTQSRSFGTTMKMEIEHSTLKSGGLEEEYEPMLSSQENNGAKTVQAAEADLLPSFSPVDKVKKPRGRPRKNQVDAGGSNAVAKQSPKRKKLEEADSSHVSELDEGPNGSVRQDTLTFTSTKKGKGAIAAGTSKKAAASDVPSPRKKKATMTHASEPSISLTEIYPGIPDFESWSKEKLQAQTGKYGYKPAGTKKVLIGQLVKVWQAIHPEKYPIPEKPESVPPWRAKSRSVSPKAAPIHGKPLKAKKTKGVSDTDETSGLDEPSKPLKVAKKSNAAKGSISRASAASSKGKAIAAARAKRKASPSRSVGSDIADPDGEESDVHANDAVGEDEVDTDTAPDELKTAGERLKEAVLKDEKFYSRILRYEPIQFDDFELILAACKIKMSKVALRDWLDSQGVIFYYDQTTGRNAQRNGARQRHA